jgi:hypothetical protein
VLHKQLALALDAEVRISNYKIEPSGRTKRGNELPPIDTIPVGVHSVGRHGLLCWQGAADRPVRAIFHHLRVPNGVSAYTVALVGRRLTQAVRPQDYSPYQDRSAFGNGSTSTGRPASHHATITHHDTAAHDHARALCSTTSPGERPAGRHRLACCGQSHASRPHPDDCKPDHARSCWWWFCRSHQFTGLAQTSHSPAPMVRAQCDGCDR